MADKKISALTSATTPLAGTEVLPIVQGGSTVKVAVSDLTAGRAIAASAATITGATTAISLTLANSGGGTNATFAVTENTGVTVNLNEGATKRQLIIQQGGVETWRLNASSNWAAQAGFGVDFSGNTPLAGMTSQLLNWYEEGTYTPTVDSGFTSTGTVTIAGRYTRIGRVVTIRVVIDSTGSIYIGAGGVGVVTNALPYAQASGGRVSGTFNSIYSVSQGGLVQFSGSTAYLIPGVTAAMNSTNTQITFVCTYQV